MKIANYKWQCNACGNDLLFDIDEELEIVRIDTCFNCMGAEWNRGYKDAIRPEEESANLL